VAPDFPIPDRNELSLGSSNNTAPLVEEKRHSPLSVEEEYASTEPLSEVERQELNNDSLSRSTTRPLVAQGKKYSNLIAPDGLGEMSPEEHFIWNGLRTIDPDRMTRAEALQYMRDYREQRKVLLSQRATEVLRQPEN